MLGMERAVVAVALMATLVTGCTTPVPEARRYEMVGQIMAVRPDTREVEVKHNDIPGFMPAMTMTYIVKDAAVLQGRTPGDLITATLMVSPGDAWLTVVTKTGTAPLPADAPTRIPVAASVTTLAPGGTVPDTSLTADDGRPLSLSTWRGTAVAVTFIYTRCPLPQFCPLMDRRFAELQAAAAVDPVLRGHVRLLSVSFDPANDLPPQLAAHAATLGANPEVWRFATAPEDTIDRFAAAFGVNVIREADGTITHNLRTAVIDANGRVVSIHDSNSWTVTQLAGELKSAIAAR